jgi:prephenate dehydratase
MSLDESRDFFLKIYFYKLINEIKNLITSAAIQGIKGSFHHIVSQEYFNDAIAVDSLLTKKSDAVIMAIENSIAVSIIPNYALIDHHHHHHHHHLHIIGEHYLDIQQHLMAWPNQGIMDIKEVYSHPMALLQCKEFFKKQPHITLIENKDTTEVAQRIYDNKLEGVGAIASKLASELFGLEILEESIQTIKHNETRFFIVKTSNSEILENEINKASLKFEFDHNRGSLAAMLNVMSDCKLNLAKIQSLPKIETPWKYAFFADITFETYEDYKKAKAIISIMAQDFKILGEYKNAIL